MGEINVSGLKGLISGIKSDFNGALQISGDTVKLLLRLSHAGGLALLVKLHMGLVILFASGTGGYALDTTGPNVSDSSFLRSAGDGGAGHCWVQRYSLPLSHYTYVYIVWYDGLTWQAPMSGGTYWRGGTATAYRGGQLITAAGLAECLKTPVSNVANFSENGTDGTYATDPYIGFSFTLLAPAGNLAAGNHEYSFGTSNSAPTVSPSATPNPASSAQLVTLSSGASDPETDPMTYAWTQVGTPAVTLSSTTAENPNFTAPTLAIGDSPITLTFSVVATDDNAASSSAQTVGVVINPPPNTPPVAVGTGSPNPAEAGALVTLDGSESYDDDGHTLTYQWYKTGGPPVTLSSMTVASPTFTAPAWRLDGQNTYNFGVQVLDGYGGTDIDYFSITVQDTEDPTINGMPADIAQDTDAGVDTGMAVWIEPTASDNSGSTGLTLVQTAGLGSGSDFPLGETTVTYTATDLAGNSASASFTVTISDVEDPVISGMPADIPVNTDAGLPTAVVTWTLPTAADNVLVTSFTSDYPSGYAFPIGATLVTYTALDAAGNSATASFTVTVTDNEPPEFTTFPDDIYIEIYYPDTTGVASWTEPTASDNDGLTVTIDRIAGLTSGASFPIGDTTVTYRATDTSGNTTDSSFVVTVYQIPPATVIYVVNSDDDESFTFTSTATELSAVVVTSGGSGSSAPLLIRDGSYGLSISVPSGFAFTDAGCNDGDSTIDAATRSGTLVLSAGENVTCTLEAVNSRERTMALIGTMMETRGQMIIQNGPNVNRRIGRLTGQSAGAGGFSGFGVSYQDSSLPVSVNVGAETVEFSYSSRNRTRDGGSVSLAVDPMAVAAALTSDAEISSLSTAGGVFSLVDQPADAPLVSAPANPMVERWEIWAEGSITSFGVEGYDGTFGIVHIGADYLINPNLLIGLGAQVDWIDMTGTDASAISGVGYMVGPYLTAQLSERLFFDARAAWGQSNNAVTPFGTYTDQVMAERWLATAALIGDFDYGEFNIRPEARLSYFTETSEAYNDGLGIDIPAVTVSFGTFEVGPTVSRSFTLANDAQLSLSAGIEGIWTFDVENTGLAPDEDSPTEGFRGRAEVGAQYVFANGFNITGSISYDGIGNAAFEAWTAEVALEYQF